MTSRLVWTIFSYFVCCRQYNFASSKLSSFFDNFKLSTYLRPDQGNQQHPRRHKSLRIMVSFARMVSERKEPCEDSKCKMPMWFVLPLGMRSPDLRNPAMTGQILHVHEGKAANALIPFLEKLNLHRIIPPHRLNSSKVYSKMSVTRHIPNSPHMSSFKAPNANRTIQKRKRTISH